MGVPKKWMVDVMESPTNMVDGFSPPEKYESVGMMIPSVWLPTKSVFQTTNQYSYLQLKLLGETNYI